MSAKRIAKSGQAKDRVPGNSEWLIYVVDDELMVAEVVETVLSQESYRVRLFDNPQSALEAFIAAEPKPDLVFTDYVMGEMSGLELIEQCKRIHPRLKTILYSGSVGQEIWEESDIRPDDFLSKPFRPKALLQIVRGVLEGHHRSTNI
ncbi:MAG: response regulator [Verrucomicrobia bacterium]|nr:response regulator [Verrucomicrobiota bacterium]